MKYSKRKLYESIDLYDIWHELQDRYGYEEGDVIDIEDLYSCIGDDYAIDIDVFENKFDVVIDFDGKENEDEQHIQDILLHYGPDALKDYGYDEYGDEYDDYDDDMNESYRKVYDVINESLSIEHTE